MKDPRDLIAGHLDDTLSGSERNELTAWLKAHPDNLRQFVDASLFDESLRTAVRSRCQQEAMESFDEPLEEGQWRRALRAFGTISKACLGSRVRVAMVGVGAVALLVGMGWLHWPRPSTAAAGEVAWARVVQTRSTQVASVMPALQVGRALPASRIVLLTGALELSLSNGVTIVFEGPGDLELVTPMRVVLRSGQTVVRVPAEAIGFQLETTTAQVTDLGTEFGVKCGPGGVSEVLVFDGKVLASAPGGTDAFPRQLTAGTAARFAPDQTRPNPIAYRPERFVRRLTADKPVELDEPGSPLFNPTQHEEIVVVRPDRVLTIDGDLSDWNGAHGFRAVRNESAGEFVEGRMRYDAGFLYVGAHVGDPAPLRNVVDPATDPELGWRGGGLQIRIATDPAIGWPVDGNSAAYYTMRRLATDDAQVARATNPHLVHLTLWHHAPSAQACLHLAFGMDLHGGRINPPGYRAAYRKDPDGRGYTLEYAIPWSLLNASRVPQSGDALAVTWTAHWSDASGRLWRGQWVELRNAAEPLRIHTWERAATWGKAVFQ
ncbi:MAG: hypothetical protein J0M24_24830 [Verrucomicrobia bacterium]|nr:hypothetical protein [Verrucomicrobiota bacterium]